VSASIQTIAVDGTTYQARRVSRSVIEVDGTSMEYDFRQISHDLFSLILDGKSYLVHSLTDELRRSNHALDDIPSKTVRVSIKGVNYEVVLDDERSLRLKQFFVKAEAGSSAHIVRAPMPGLISRIEVEVGSTVAKGEGLLVLEAMKMENEIRASDSGRIKEIHVHKAKTVEKDEPLITIELLEVHSSKSL
jgi:biotin carboxyl carrier protein